MNVKFDLRHLILEKTSINREHAPKLYFERLKLAHKNREISSVDNGDDNVINGLEKRDVQGAGEGNSRNKEKQRQQDFMFV
jgi:hypothetical protein